MFVFLICAIENEKARQEPLDFNILKVAFEIVSAFGNVGASMGYKGGSLSFSVSFSVVSKLLVILTLLLGRHRGLLESMKDQEYADYTPQDLVNWWIATQEDAPAAKEDQEAASGQRTAEPSTIQNQVLGRTASVHLSDRDVQKSIVPYELLPMPVKRSIDFRRGPDGLPLRRSTDRSAK